MKGWIVSPGARLCAKLRAWQERASATTFFFPWMWKTCKSILCSIWILTAAIRMGLYMLRAQRELEIPNDVVESVWMATCQGVGWSDEDHSKPARIVTASLKKMLKFHSVLMTGSPIWAILRAGAQKASLAGSHEDSNLT